MRPPAGSGSCFRLTKRVRFAHSRRHPGRRTRHVRGEPPGGTAARLLPYWRSGRTWPKGSHPPPPTPHYPPSVDRSSWRGSRGISAKTTTPAGWSPSRTCRGESAPGRALSAVEVGKALPHLKEDADPDSIEDDWLCQFLRQIPDRIRPGDAEAMVACSGW